MRKDMPHEKRAYRASKAPVPPITAVDLFCGVGGLSLGLRDSGIRVAAGVDIDPSCRGPYEINVQSHFLEKDVSSLLADDLRGLYGASTLRVLAACAPCQPFSGYTTKRRVSDQRWKLLLDVIRLISDVKPEMLTVENVPRLAKMSLWTAFVQQLSDMGYHCSWAIVDSAQYGVPQRRRRLVLVASLLGPIDIAAAPTQPIASVRSAIGHLPPVRAGVRNRSDALHASRALTVKNLRRIQASRPSGTWREWPKSLRAKCHNKATGKTYPSVYGRMAWDQPSPTITTQFYGFGNGRFGHPSQNRAITLREGALLQSFPANFAFTDANSKVNFRMVGKFIGNAVPPKLAYSIGTLLVDHATSSAGSGFSRKSSASK
jgi:DNA (cytosine-5)-methyltransferase 1